MNININNHCSENWDDMTPVEQGRFCQSCQKNVIDFTTMNLVEIKAYLAQHKEATCGQINNYQLENFNAVYREFPTPSNIKRWGLAAVLVGAFAYPSVAETTDVFASLTFVESPYLRFFESNFKTSTPSTVTDSIIVSGRVENIYGSPLNATVYIEQLDLTMVTNAQGEFSFKIPSSTTTITITSRSNRYLSSSLKITATQSQKNLLFQLKQTSTTSIKKGKMHVKH